LTVTTVIAVSRFYGCPSLCVCSFPTTTACFVLNSALYGTFVIQRSVLGDVDYVVMTTLSCLRCRCLMVASSIVAVENSKHSRSYDVTRRLRCRWRRWQSQTEFLTTIWTSTNILALSVTSVYFVNRHQLRHLQCAEYRWNV